jgi:hypothetical protein
MSAVRELIEETGHTMTVGNLTLLSGADARVSLPASKRHLVYVHMTSVHVPYVNTNLIRTTAKVEQVAIAWSTSHPNGT